MDKKDIPPGMDNALNVTLVEGLLGRRARRFFRGASIPDGYFSYKSKLDPLPLTELEQMMVLTAMARNTGWHNLIMRAERYAPHLSNYACSAGGRTFPSAAGFHTSELFFTDDDGVYLLPKSFSIWTEDIVTVVGLPWGQVLGFSQMNSSRNRSCISFQVIS